MAVEWKLVPIQEYKLDRLRELSGSMDDAEVVDEAINRVLFTDEIRALIGDETLADILAGAGDDDEDDLDDSEPIDWSSAVFGDLDWDA